MNFLRFSGTKKSKPTTMASATKASFIAHCIVTGHELLDFPPLNDCDFYSDIQYGDPTFVVYHESTNTSYFFQ